MPPKADKAKQKEKEKVAVDKTFGMKNKNKSKVVQKYIKAIVNNAAGAPKGGKEEAQRAEKEAKQKEVAKAAIMNSLFNMQTDKKGRAFDAVAKKKAKQQEEEAIAAGRKLDEKVRKEIIEAIANTIRLTNVKGIRMTDLGPHPILMALKDKYADTFKILSLVGFIRANPDTFWMDDSDSSNPTIRCQEDVDAEVAPDDRTIEEIIEDKRAALPPGGTPVTLETFKAWKERREAQRLAEEEEESKEKAKKAKSKNFVGLSGRDLFTFDASLFADDEDAVDAEEYDERSEPEEEEEETVARAPKDEADEEEDDEQDEEGGVAAESGAAGSGDAAPAEAINESLFLGGGELPDDLDDLDDDDDQT